MKLILTGARFSVCQLPADAALPAGLAATSAFFSVTRTRDELSIVCESALAPPGARQEPGYRALQVEGPLAFGLTGILAALLAPLAQAKISVFAVSTYNTDYVLVKEATLDRAIEVLLDAGHTVERPG